MIRRTLVVLAFLAGIVSVLIGFRWGPGRDYFDEWPGWVALTITFYVASALPFPILDRGRRPPPA